MNRWTDADITAALGLGTAAGGESVTYTGIGTDTRTIQPGNVFVALRGETHDAHAFLGSAADAGATAAIVERVPDDAPTGLRYFVVKDTLEALGTLGRFHRRRMAVRVVAITGSNGKTTTKELVRSVLATRFRVHATPGNWNNLFGVPLTLLGAPIDTEVIVAELGTNVPGEVARLAGIAEPDAVIVTTVAAEHLEGLGDLEGVLREETSVLSWLGHGPAVVADEPAVLLRRARELADEVHAAGFSERADRAFRGFDRSVDEDGRVRFTWAGRDVALRLRGKHNASNAMLALALGRLFGIDEAEAVAAVATVEPARMRGEFHRFGTLTVIADCYNSNPGSLETAIALLLDVDRRGGRVAILGTMRELGPTSAVLHEQAARAVADSAVDLIVATGEFVPAFRALEGTSAGRLILEEDPIAAFDALVSRLKGDEVVLLKASRGVRLERLLPRFEARWTEGGVLHPHGEAFGSRASDTFTGDRGNAATAEHPPTGGNGNGGGIRAEARYAIGG